MKAMHFLGRPERPRLVETDTPKPEPAARQLLIQVYAAGVTPTELIWYPTLHQKTGETRHNAIPAHEFSGVVAALGEAVTEFQIGDQVFGMNDWFQQGAAAEYCLTEPGSVAAKPSGLTHEQAATVPISGLTAWQGLFEHANLQPGERVLVHGGGGAVGAFAVQLASAKGAQVMATASAKDASFVLQLGAKQVIDYQTQRFEDFSSDMDLVFDTVGGETLQRSWKCLKSTGRMVTVAANGENATDERTQKAFFIVEPSRPQLEQLGALLQEGHIRTTVDVAVSLDQADSAYAKNVKSSTGRGKIVLVVKNRR